MDQKTYEKVRDAADARVRDDSNTSFQLADAVLEAVPNGGTGGRPKLGASTPPVSEQLQELAAQLEADGVTTPRGDAYSDLALDELRKTAMAWPPNQRHAEAAFRTHQEAGSPNTEGGKRLALLCRVARGENPRRPADVDADAWSTAVISVQAASAKGRKWLVSANVLRLAMGRKANVPTAEQPVAERVREVLRMVKEDPKVQEIAIEAASEDRVLGATLGSTAAKADERYQERFERRHGLGPGTPHARVGRMFDFNKSMQLVKREIVRAREALTEILPLTEGEAEEAELYISGIQREVEALEAVSRSKGLDADLQRLLEGPPNNGSNP